MLEASKSQTIWIHEYLKNYQNKIGIAFDFWLLNARAQLSNLFFKMPNQCCLKVMSQHIWWFVTRVGLSLAIRIMLFINDMSESMVWNLCIYLVLKYINPSEHDNFENKRQKQKMNILIYLSFLTLYISTAIILSQGFSYFWRKSSLGSSSSVACLVWTFPSEPALLALSDESCNQNFFKDLLIFFHLPPRNFMRLIDITA